MQEGPVVKKSLAFSIDTIKYFRVLIRKKEFDIARQLKRSATSIGANVFEAQYAESKLDFIHKMKVASKEASESLYWVSLCERIPELKFHKKC
jgi:four helix bundle protein